MTESQQLRERIARVDGGELTGASSAYPYSVIFPPAGSRTVIYTTEIHGAIQLLAADDDAIRVGVIGRYGLPREEDLPGISSFVRDCAVYFLGDCDPFDLLTFAWLRQHLSMRFLGTSDVVVSALGVDVNDRLTIPLAEEEQRAMSLLREVWPNFAESVGPDCARLLGANRKLELEALVSFHTRPVSNLLRLV